MSAEESVPSYASLLGGKRKPARKPARGDRTVSPGETFSLFAGLEMASEPDPSGSAAESLTAESSAAGSLVDGASAIASGVPAASPAGGLITAVGSGVVPEREEPALRLTTAAAPAAGKSAAKPEPVRAVAAPGQVRTVTQADVPAGVRVRPVIYTVRELLAAVRLQLEAANPGVLTVEGEISNCRPAASGHLYFTLRDGEAQLSVVMFRRASSMLKFRPRDGLQVELRGRLAVYESRGQLQLIADWMRPRGEGALRLAIEELKQQLAAEGLFALERKRPLPPFPHCIGIVTSPHGAALRDIIHVIRRRHARLNLLIFPAPVQGPDCPAGVAAGIRWFNRNPDRVDLVLVTRGGGSFEDLAGFSDERVVRAIAGSTLPVVSAIGHEVDTPLADLAADLRAPTPSAAAELITAAQHRVGERVLLLERRTLRAGQFALLAARQRLARLAADQVLRRVRDRILQRQQRVEELQRRLRTAFATREHRRLRLQRDRLAALETRLRLQDPTLRLALEQRRVAACRARLQGAQSALVRLQPALLLGGRGRLDSLTARLQAAPATLLRQRRAALAQTAGRLQALSPLAVLQRGYAIVAVAGSGAIVRSPQEAPEGTVIEARLAAGVLTARVTGGG